ncbi:MAG: OsmC family protein [Steroidobacteraceae bacterium]
MPITRHAEAIWEGSVREGAGRIALGSGAFDGPYSFHSRFESAPATNPEELIGGAHAGCFSMALAGALGRAGATPDAIHTTAAVTLVPEAGGFTIAQIALRTRVSASGIDAAKFAEVAEHAKQTCPVSRALAGVAKITLDAQLVDNVD